jgi:tetratricopeptide (TPR) repeat protein
MSAFTDKLGSLWRRFFAPIREYFAVDVPTVGGAVLPFALLANILYFRHPRSNFIFDEQEALLANPYVRSVMDASPKYLWRHAFTTDFWGRGPDATIGSYRPLPNMVWRVMWWITQKFVQIAQKVSTQSASSPLLCHWVNLMLHGLNGAMVTVLVYSCTKRRSLAWLSGLIFTACAVLTEAVSGVVGLSDIMGLMGPLLALLCLRLPMGPMVLGVFLSTLIGLFSKESALCCVPLVPFAAFALAPYFHPQKPRRLLRGLAALLGSGEAFVIYVELRRKLFPVKTPTELLAENLVDKPWTKQLSGAFLRWYAQPNLPHDALNNPLVDATPVLRVAGALRVFARGLGQVVLPLRLSGDYSAPQEPIPESPVFFLSVVGGAVMVLAIPVAFMLVALASVRLWRGRKQVSSEPGIWNAFVSGDARPLLAVMIAWVVVSYFPVSNIPIVLPTVRAERFWYFPALGTSVVLGWFFWKVARVANAWLTARAKQQAAKTGTVPGAPSAWRALYNYPIVPFIALQCFAARYHACDYSDDLQFWQATQRAVPNSSKAHLNYSVMLGARGRHEERLKANQRALELQPKWAMANVYLGDTLCRMKRAPESVVHYMNGFDLSPNDTALLALALQCLWDEGLLQSNVKDETFDPTETFLTIEARAQKHPGSWYEWMVRDMRANGVKNRGVDPKKRPRGYNEGPRE